MRRWGVSIAVQPAAVLLAAAGLIAASAQAVEIVVVDAKYSTDLSIMVNKEADPAPPHDDLTSTVTTQTTTSFTPISNELRFGGTPEPWDLRLAKATADTFSISTETYSGPAGTREQQWATADSMVSFTVLQDAATTLALEFGFIFPPTSEGFVSLFDCTLGRSLFSYWWTGIYGVWQTNIPWDYANGRASFGEEPLLLASHTYELKLHATAVSTTNDGTRASISVTGFESIAAPIPEPEAYALTFAGLIAVGIAAFRRKRLSIPKA
jgi:hypothetical protein